jgi:TolB-like protein/Flp pilus assembly protein TadD
MGFLGLLLLSDRDRSGGRLVYQRTSTLNFMQDLKGEGPDLRVEPPSADAVLAELARILSSQTFQGAQRPSNFLKYVVEQTLAGHGEQIKEYCIATDVFGRKESFDPRLDPIVRVEATKLRSRLAGYYRTEGQQDRIRIELPKRGYAPTFRDQAHLEPVEKSRSPLQDLNEGKAQPAPVGLIRWKAIAVAFGAILFVCLSAFGLTSLWNRRSVAPDAKSIAVLPFTNLGEAREDEYFSDGLTDELIASLGRVPGLRVVARGSVFQFKGKTYDIREVGRRLGVRTVLEGSVRKFGTHLRITVHLDDASNGYRVWSNIYEREASDVFAIQREIAQALVNSLGVQFSGEDWASKANQQHDPVSVDPVAYQAYLKGLFFWNKNNAASIRTAIDYFQQALAKDPRYPPIYTGLGRCYTALPVFTSTSTNEVIPEIRRVASKALELDPQFGEAHLQLGEAAFLEYDWPRAERELQRAVKLSPSDAVVHRWYSYYLGRMGRLDEELAETLAAQELDPVSPYLADGVASSYRDLRRYDDAIEQYQKALALEPNFAMSIRGLGITYLFRGQPETGLIQLQRVAQIEKEDSSVDGELGYAFAISGKRAQAQSILAKLLDKSVRGAVHPLHVAQIYIGLGDRDRAFEWLSKAVDQHEISLSLKTDPMFDPLRADPRFAGLLRRMKLG